VPHDDSRQPIDPAIQSLIRRKVSRIIGRAGLTKQDHEDLEHDLVVEVLRRLPKFDSDRSSLSAFLNAVLDHGLADILRHQLAAKRNPQRVRSLHAKTKSEEGDLELEQTLGSEDLARQRGRHPRSAEELAQLTQDMAEALDGLSDDVRAVAERLAQGLPMTAIAKELGKSRHQVRQAVRQVRQRFEDLDLKGYL
jgi:RNA polymerase sigma-70 factor (ECF subfamily)